MNEIVLRSLANSLGNDMSSIKVKGLFISTYENSTNFSTSESPFIYIRLYTFIFLTLPFKMEDMYHILINTDDLLTKFTYIK